MADKMVLIVQSYNDVQLTICPNLVEIEINNLKVFCSQNESTLFSFKERLEFKFEYSVRSYDDPNSIVQTSHIASELEKYFRGKDYIVSFINIPENNRNW